MPLPPSLHTYIICVVRLWYTLLDLHYTYNGCIVSYIFITLVAWPCYLCNTWKIKVIYTCIVLNLITSCMIFLENTWLVYHKPYFSWYEHSRWFLSYWEGKYLEGARFCTKVPYNCINLSYLCWTGNILDASRLRWCSNIPSQSRSFSTHLDVSWLVLMFPLN